MILEGILLFVIVVLTVLIGKELLAKPPPPPKLVKPPEQKQRVSLALYELKNYAGQNEDTPIYVSIEGKIYDVTRGRAFYGPNGPYGAFAGNEITCALARSSTDAKDVNIPWNSLTPVEKSTLADWKNFFATKYDEIGTLSDPPTAK